MIAARYSGYSIPGSEITKRGLRQLEDYACRRCHISGAEGNQLAANLDLSQQVVSPEVLDDAIQFPVLFMPEFHFKGQQRVDLINALLFGGKKFKAPVTEAPRVVHFEGEESSREFQFEKFCGNCHRVLTDRFGGLGEGLIGPNISGLFSPFYRANFGEENQRWTRGNLEKWLKNPRKIRPYTQMLPVSLKAQEFDRIYTELQHGESVVTEEKP